MAATLGTAAAAAKGRRQPAAVHLPGTREARYDAGRRAEEVDMRSTFLTGCGALLAALASSGCASFFPEADTPAAAQPGPSSVYGAASADKERYVVVRIPPGTRGPVVVTVACAGAPAVMAPAGWKPSPYEDEPAPVAYKPSPYEDDAPVPLPVRPSPYKDVKLP
jgi:hypothetical protein